MGNRYLVVSDLHIADVEDHRDGWKAYKASRFVIDEAFAALLRDFVARPHGASPQTLVLNGDIFDFDLITAVPEAAPFPVSAFERERGLDATEPKSAWKLARILAEHEGFVMALAEFALGGNRVVYVLGNHDRELHFPAVQAVLTDALEGAAQRLGRRLPRGALRFEPWFYYVPGEVYVEHGNQFDHYSSFRDVLAPTVDGKEGPAIAVPMANLSNRYMGTRMGFFNPHAADFILNLYRYLAHWLEHYAFTNRSLVMSWFVGSLLVVWKLLHLKKLQLLRRRDEAALDEVAARSGLPTETLERLRRLQRPPIANRLYRVLREFWIDRLVILAFMVLGSLALALLPVQPWVKLSVPLTVFPLAFTLYEWLAKGDNIFTVEQHMPGCARAIAALLPVRVVAFGHAHKPRMVPLGSRTCFVDTGAWAPISEPGRWGELAPGFRNYLVVDCEGEDVHVRFDCWDGSLRAARNEDVETSAAATQAVG